MISWLDASWGGGVSHRFGKTTEMLRVLLRLLLRKGTQRRVEPGDWRQRSEFREEQNEKYQRMGGGRLWRSERYFNSRVVIWINGCFGRMVVNDHLPSIGVVLFVLSKGGVVYCWVLDQQGLWNSTLGGPRPSGVSAVWPLWEQEAVLDDSSCLLSIRCRIWLTGVLKNI